MFNGKRFDGIRGVLFDCYKTLIDIQTDESSIRTYEPISRWLMYHGVKIAPDDLMREYKWRCKEEIERRWDKHSELKVEEIFRKICSEHASWPINDITVGIEATRLFRAASVRRLQAIPQSIRILQALSGYPLGIVSNGQRVFSELELRHLGLHNYFKFIIFSSDFGYYKPDPRIFLAGIQQLGLRPEETLYIGDSYENDINPSRNLGMKAMHINDARKFFNVG
jgi:putative hydrolase of the HAD superfamily